MYTIDDIREIAIQIERNGEQTYRSASQNATESELVKLLNWMADEENRHARWFESLPTKARWSESKELNEMEAMGRALLQEMVGDQTFSLEKEQLLEADNMLELLTQSLSFENDTILFYGMLKPFIEDQAAIVQLELVIEEERGHVRVLEKLKQKFISGAAVDLSCIKTIE